MIDREKLMTTLQYRINEARNKGSKVTTIFISTLSDCMTLLKEQEAVKPVLDEQTGRLWLCGNCGSYVGFEDSDPHDPNEFDKFCRECGRPVLWEGR